MLLALLMIYSSAKKKWRGVIGTINLIEEHYELQSLSHLLQKL